MRRAHPFGLGTGPIGGLYTAVSDADADATLAAAWDAGVRWFDTAPHYGAGLAERRLGRFLASVPRAEAVVCTKVGRLLTPGRGRAGDEGFADAADHVRVRDHSRDGVRRSLHGSLRRLRLDRVDVAFVHDPDEHEAQTIAESVPALCELRSAGVVGAVGVAMNDAAALARIVRACDLDVVLIAGRFTLLDRAAGDDLLPLCAERGVGVVVGGVFNSGVLADPRPGARFDYRPASPAVLAAALRLRATCARHGVPLPAAAVQFPLRHPAVRTVLVGARSAAEARADLAWAHATLPDEVWRDLEPDPMRELSCDS